MKVIVRYYLDCGRMGDLSGLFVTSTEELEAAYGKMVYFGEVLGKHSDICVTFDASQISIVTADEKFIEQFESVIGTGTISGYNPFDYIYDEEDE